MFSVNFSCVSLSLPLLPEAVGTEVIHVWVTEVKVALAAEEVVTRALFRVENLEPEAERVIVALVFLGKRPDVRVVVEGGEFILCLMESLTKSLTGHALHLVPEVTAALTERARVALAHRELGLALGAEEVFNDVRHLWVPFKRGCEKGCGHPVRHSGQFLNRQKKVFVLFWGFCVFSFCFGVWGRALRGRGPRAEGPWCPSCRSRSARTTQSCQ